MEGSFHFLFLAVEDRGSRRKACLRRLTRQGQVRDQAAQTRRQSPQGDFVVVAAISNRRMSEMRSPYARAGGDLTARLDGDILPGRHARVHKRVRHAAR